MSKRATDNAVIRAITQTCTAMDYDVAALEQNKKHIEMLRDTSSDDRVRIKASKLISDISLKIADLKFRMYEHENPATQKHDVTGNITIVSHIPRPE